MAPQRRVLHRRRARAAAALAVTLLGACGSGSPAATAPNTASPAAGEATGSPPTAGTPAAAATPPPSGPGPAATAMLAFGGDVHFEGSAEAALTDGLGSAFDVLAAADVAVVNLETAITERGTAAPKQYTFRAPARALEVLRDAGIDAVLLANNHGMDYGQQGLADTLQAAEQAGMPLLGAGATADQAYAPWRTEVNGLALSFLGATDVLDSFALDTWPATEERAGLASAKDPERLLEAVRQEAATADVVTVVLHWGREQVRCPTERQQELAGLLADAGADVVVGSHAHVVQPAGTVGDTYVHYGLGNFVWYARGGLGAETGVATVTVGADGVRDSAWHPAEIASGRPQLVQGERARAMTAELATMCPG